jgi:hypothetical protein
MWSPSSARRRHDEHKADRQNYTALKERSIRTLGIGEFAGVESVPGS